MRCQHCGNRISLLRKLKDSEFCSDEHRHLFTQQQQSLAVTRLIDAHEKTPLPPPRPRSDSRAGTTRSASRSANKKPVESKESRLEAKPNLFGPQAFTLQARGQKHHQVWRLASDPADPALYCGLPVRELRLSVCRFERAGRVPLQGQNPLLAPEAGGMRRNLESLDASFAASPVLPRPMLAAIAESGDAGAEAGVEAAGPEPVPPPHPLEAVALAGLSQWTAAWRAGWEPRRPSEAIVVRPEEASSPLPAPAPAPRPAAAAFAQGPAAESTLPEVDFEALALEEVCSRHRPGLMRLRMPRTRAPKSPRNAAPLLGHPLAPLRATGLLTQPGGSGVANHNSAVPSGLPVSWPPHWFSAGNRTMLAPAADPAHPVAQPYRAPAPHSRGAARAMSLARMVSLPLETTIGRRVVQHPVSPEALEAKLRPGRPVLLAETICRLLPARAEKVEIPLHARSSRRIEEWRCKAPSRPVISYHWRVVQPEIDAVPECDWVPARTEPVALRFEFPYYKPAPGLAPHKAKPFPPQLPVVSGDLGRLWRPAPPPTAGLSGCASKVFSLDAEMDKCIPHEAAKSPSGVLTPLAPATVRPVPRPSGNVAKADWQRSRWSSVYGSAIWRIAIGRFSGALDQAPGFVRWAALGVAMALAAVAVFPGGRPEAPEDRDWVIAKRADPQPAESGAGAGGVAAKPVRRALPPVAAVSSPRPRRGAGRSGADEPEEQAPGLSGFFGNFQSRLSERAAVALTDDFRNGLAEWEGAGEWARTWSYDASGFVRTGAMALYAPTRGLTDYRMEFLGQIERRSMGWVIRAQNPRNYYAIKLTIIDAGPVPEVALIRYPVINGVQGAAKQTELPIDVRVDTVYRVLTEVNGDSYSVAVQGKIIDSWNESRLDRGGVGLFSGKGELARVRWVGVWHQYDTLGRLCALLAPSGLPGRERGANQ